MDPQDNKTPVAVPGLRHWEMVEVKRAQAVRPAAGTNAVSAAGAASSQGSSGQNALGTLRQSSSGQNSSGSAGTAGNGAAANPEDLYESAFSYLKSGDYDSSEQYFSQFVDTYPDHALAGNAQYWLGESHYVRGDFEKAARIFAAGYRKYPKGPKAPDNLLKLGLSLANTGNTEDACIALRQLESEYDSGVGPVLRRAQQEISRLKCTS